MDNAFEYNIIMKDKVLTLLKKSNAISTGHFVYTSGKHASRYINKMALFAHPIYASSIGALFATKYKDKEIEVVVAPALGGIILSQWVAYHLSMINNRDIIGIYTEKGAHDEQVFTRDYDTYVKRKNILIVEDIVTTGGSVSKVVRSVKKAGGKIIDACSIININPNSNSLTKKNIGTSLSSLIKLPITLYDEKDCILCKQSIPINTKLAHGREYLQKKLIN